MMYDFRPLYYFLLAAALAVLGAVFGLGWLLGAIL